MKKIRALAAALPLTISLMTAVHAQYAPPPMPESAPRKTVAHPVQVDESQLENHRTYRDKAGHQVHAPSKVRFDHKVPDGASARCRDGTYSFSHSRRGTCSHHGGVGAWL